VPRRWRSEIADLTLHPDKVEVPLQEVLDFFCQGGNRIDFGRLILKKKTGIVHLSPSQHFVLAY
jgi:hypothetical protein